MPPRTDDLLVGAKADLTGDTDGISGLTGDGIDTLLDAIERKLSSRAAGSAAFTRHRHRMALENAAVRLTGLLRPELGAIPPEIVSLELWEVIRSLESITGSIDIETVLGEIFSAFCIGK